MAMVVSDKPRERAAHDTVVFTRLSFGHQKPSLAVALQRERERNTSKYATADEKQDHVVMPDACKANCARAPSWGLPQRVFVVRLVKMFHT